MERFEQTFFDTFDTVVRVIYYAESEEKAEEYGAHVHSRFLELHKKFDGYHTYEDQMSLMEVNQLAGQGKVALDPELYDLIELSLERYDNYGVTNIAIGPVTDVWHEYRDGHVVGLDVQEEVQEGKVAELPPMELLEEAAKHSLRENIVLYPEEHAVEIKDPLGKIDLGAVAKGYATELVAKELEEMGVTAALISAGGNVRIIGTPPEADRKYFGIGLQDPDAATGLEPEAENMIDQLYINDTSVVTSGDYQRFYVVDGKLYHHLIDPMTLFPADHFRAVTIVTEDSGLADFLSTTAFCLPYEESRALVESLDGVEAYWIHRDGSVTFTEGLSKNLKSQGATNQEAA